MEVFESVFSDSAVEAYMVYSEYSVYVGNSPEIGIKITQNHKGQFGYKLSHHYRGYISSINNCYDNERDALWGAMHKLLSSYDEDDDHKHAVWTPNKYYYHMTEYEDPDPEWL